MAQMTNPNDDKQDTKPKRPVDAEWLGLWLKSIDNSLRSINNKLTFFVILIILAMLLGFCQAITNI